jgi:transketolase
MKHGVEDRFGQVGPVDYLQEVYGLTAEALVKNCEMLLGKKK